MSVKLDNFVQINIVKHDLGTSVNTRYNTAVYVHTGSLGTGEVFGYYTKNGVPGGDGTTKAKPKAASAIDDDLVTCFFNNGGQYLHIVKGIQYETTNNEGWQYTVDGTAYSNLPQEEIVIIYPDLTAGSAIIKSGTEQKIFILPVNAVTAPATTASGIVYKYVTSSSYNFALGTVGAYYTKIRLDDESTVRDYAFTAENVKVGTYEAQTGQNAIVSACITNNINVDTYLAGSIRNIGGNDSKGEDITNLFMRIVLQQTLVDAALQVLITKLKMNSMGITTLQTAISTELNRYVNNGYIDTERRWTDEDLYIDGELVAQKNMPLPNGYKVHVSPIEQANIESHTAPDIYIVYGDQVGIRKIVISGEVF